jgi:ABC-2 type transport system permease protein
MRPEIITLTLRQLLSRGRLLLLGALAALPPLLGLLYTFSDSPVDPQTFLAGAYTNLVYVIVAPVTALVFAAAVFGSELEDGTIVYLLLKPVPRWQIVVSKLVATAAVIGAFVSVSIFAAALVVDRGFGELEMAYAFTLGAVLGGAAYAAIFGLLGAVTSRALLAGLLYVFVWEGLVTDLFSGTRSFSVREYMRGIADVFSTLPPDVFDAQLSGERALIGCLVVVALFTALTIYRLRTINLT